jgi:hypothetical protein
MYATDQETTELLLTNDRFASLKETALALRDQLVERYQLEQFLLTKLCKDSNGFAGCKSTYSDTGNPCGHCTSPPMQIRSILCLIKFHSLLVSLRRQANSRETAAQVQLRPPISFSTRLRRVKRSHTQLKVGTLWLGMVRDDLFRPVDQLRHIHLLF